MTMAPARLRRVITVASRLGTYEKAGHAAVVGRPATSILSLTATGTPKRGEADALSADRARASDRTASCSRNVMKIAGSSILPMRASVRPIVSATAILPDRCSATNEAIVTVTYHSFTRVRCGPELWAPVVSPANRKPDRTLQGCGNATDYGRVGPQVRRKKPSQQARRQDHQRL